MQKNNFKNKKAITLISLVITIVILISLAAIAINMAIGNNGLFNKTKFAKQEYTNAADKEKQDLYSLTNDIDTSVGGIRTISDAEYNDLKAKVALLENPIEKFEYTLASGFTLHQDCTNKGYYNKITKQVTLEFFFSGTVGTTWKKIATIPAVYAPKIGIQDSAQDGMYRAIISIYPNGEILAWQSSSSGSTVRGTTTYYVD